MSSAGRRRIPKKKQSKEPVFVTQEDFYLEATNLEEQAERWILSDIKKTLRFYIQASELYTKALHCTNEASQANRYNILYNQVRLYLVVYTEYVAANGYINILNYINNLEELVGLDQIIFTLPEITQKFESVLQECTSDNSVWDLKFNLLTCYLLLIEGINGVNPGIGWELDGAQVLTLFQEKFYPCFRELVDDIITSLKEWSEIQQSTDAELNNGLDEKGFQKDALQDQQASNDGTGVKHMQDSDQQETSLMEVSDQITPDTLIETYTIAYKLIEAITALIVESKYNGKNALFNDSQIFFFVDALKRFQAQLEEPLLDGQDQQIVDSLDINLSKFSIYGQLMLLEGNIQKESLTKYLEEFELPFGQYNDQEIDIKILSVKADLIETILSTLDDGQQITPANVEEQWFFSSMLSKIYQTISKQLNERRGDVISGKIRGLSDQLSNIVFRQCDIIINASDNDLLRAFLMSIRNPSETRTIEILQKNARTFLTNAMKIAERPCGLEECIVDKLKRNYIFNQAKNRLAILNNELARDQLHQSPDMLAQISDHPYYMRLLSL